jgi:hypothetical protein
MLPALSDIMPDRLRLTVAPPASGRLDPARRKTRRQHVGRSEQNARAPRFICLPPHTNANAQSVAIIAPMPVTNATVQAPFK